MSEERKAISLNQAPIPNAKVEEFRRSGKVERVEGDGMPPEITTADEDGRIVADRILESLQTVYDPELPVNIVDLGLIYAIDIDADYNAKPEDDAHRPRVPGGRSDRERCRSQNAIHAGRIEREGRARLVPAVGEIADERRRVAGTRAALGSDGPRRREAGTINSAPATPHAHACQSAAGSAMVSSAGAMIAGVGPAAEDASANNCAIAGVGS